MIRKSILVACALTALLCVPAVAVAAPPAPSGFTVGISPQTPADDIDYSLMAEAGLTSLRLPLGWESVERQSPFWAPPDWSGFDRSVALAAEYGMRVFPFIWGTPSWVAGQPGIEPVSRWAGRAWAAFLRRAVERYGPNGSFWRENPDLPFLPIRAWEIWNEENIVSFASEQNPTKFARLLRISGKVLHRTDPAAEVIVGGFFGQPLQIPPNIASGDYLNRIYRAGNVKPYFDGVGLHPYVPNAQGMAGQIRNLRRVMRAHGDPATPIYVTELGWGSDDGPTRWELGLRGQANQLNRAFKMLSANRQRWRVRGVWWYSWSDEGGSCSFCRTAGLLTANRKAKPSWYRFNEWTGGDPDTVPRASAEDLE